MTKIKNLVAAVLGIFALVSLASLLTPSLTHGQGGKQPPLSVDVVNTPLAVRDVNNPAFQPFRFSHSFLIQEGFTMDVLTNIAPVPTGKELVLEFSAVECRVPTGERAEVTIRQATPNPGGSFNLRSVAFPVLHFQGQAFSLNADTYVANEPLRIYYPAGGYIELVMRRNAGVPGSASCEIYLSGHYVDVL